MGRGKKCTEGLYTVTELQRWSSRWFHVYVQWGASIFPWVSESFCSPMKLTSCHCSQEAGICKIHWRKTQVLLRELEAGGLCCSGYLHSCLLSSIPSSFQSWPKERDLGFWGWLGPFPKVIPGVGSSVLCSCPNPPLCCSCKLASGKFCPSS